MDMIKIRMKCLHFRRILIMSMGRARREASLTAHMRNAKHSECMGFEQYADTVIISDEILIVGSPFLRYNQ